MKRLLAAALLANHLFSQPLPTPESFFGHPIGADRQLLDWSRVAAYFDALGQASGKLRVLEIGKSAEGRPMIAAFISAPETLRNLERFREIQASLADPRKPAPSGVGKAIVLITCSIHATEVASTHSAIALAYRLITANDARTQAILDNTIVILIPSLNPDGVDIVTRWYRKTLGTPFEGTSPPELYQKYAGHDNNRDWYIFSQPETRAVVSRILNVWHPHIVLDMHQQGEYASRMFVPPWLDPIDPNLDPLIVQQTNRFGTGIAADLTAAGKTGVVVNALYDCWSPARDYAGYHNGIRILSEAASANLATPVTIAPDQIQAKALGYNPRERSWNYIQPWLGGSWSLADIVSYQLIAMESCLHQAALGRVALLRNFVAMGRNAMARQRPYAFVVPKDQADPAAAQKLLETLRFGMVDIERARSPFDAGGKRYPAGTYVIRMMQPYSGFAKTLLERQDYPDRREYPDGPPRRPYDVTAQTLPLLMGVETAAIDAGFNAALDSAQEFTFPQEKPNKVTQQRIGVYKSHVPEMDEGWTRWVLDNFGYVYRSVGNGDVRIADDLNKQFDVIVFPDQPPASIAEGFRRGAMPEEYIGGLGDEGAEALRKFVRGGGTLLFFNRSTAYATATFALKLHDATHGAKDTEYFAPGSILNADLDQSSPLSRGLPSHIAIWNEESPAWDQIDPAYRVVARYPAANVLASGYLLGEKYLAGKAALLDIPVGAGRIVLFGMRPQYRAQSYQTFKLFFNALRLKEN